MTLEQIAGRSIQHRLTDADSRPAGRSGSTEKVVGVTSTTREVLRRWSVSEASMESADRVVQTSVSLELAACNTWFNRRLLYTAAWFKNSHANTSKQTLSQNVVASLFSPLGKLAGRAIYFTCVNFFLFFKLSKAISGSTGPIFTIFSPNGRYFCEC